MMIGKRHILSWEPEEAFYPSVSQLIVSMVEAYSLLQLDATCKNDWKLCPATIKRLERDQENDECPILLSAD